MLWSPFQSLAVEVQWCIDRDLHNITALSFWNAWNSTWCCVEDQCISWSCIAALLERKQLSDHWQNHSCWTTVPSHPCSLLCFGAKTRCMHIFIHNEISLLLKGKLSIAMNLMVQCENYNYLSLKKFGSINVTGNNFAVNFIHTVHS